MDRNNCQYTSPDGEQCCEKPLGENVFCKWHAVVDLTGEDIKGKLEQRVKEGLSLCGFNLSKLNLHDVNLINADLQYADLSRADLSKAHFYMERISKVPIFLRRIFLRQIYELRTWKIVIY